MTKAQTIFFMLCIAMLGFQVFRSVGHKIASSTTQTENHFSAAH